MGIIEQLREKANALPLLPGVYIMKNSHGEVVYVGKAKRLKNRVTSYFRGEHLPKVQAMVDKVADFDVIVASSEFEALVLENSLIKRHQPHYNILLRDDKGYPFIRLDTAAEYPTFSVVNKTASDGAKYFGPFGSRGTTFEIIDAISKTLFLPTCGKKFPRDIGRERPCLNKHMGLCRGWCLPEAAAEDYRSRIAQAELILSGKADELKAELTGKMQRAAEELRFELAADYRDRLRAVERLGEKQLVIALNRADTDAVGFFRGAKTCFSVLHYSGGSLADKDFSLMEEPIEPDAEALGALLSRFYGARGTAAKTILCPFEPEGARELEQLISEASGHAVAIEVPQRGDRRKFSEAAQVNAREESLRATTAAQRRSKTLEWLQKTLALPTLPRRIEAFDVSNTGSFGVVAAMTVFVGGRPLKRDYKRFKIRTVEGQDDYASMFEAVSRRYARCIEGAEGFEEVPDLLLIDGGDTHAAAAERALGELGLALPVFGMVKDDRHRTRALINSAGAETAIVGNQAVFSFIGTIQEETHRFAIEYHRSLRSAAIGSTLDAIPGIGEKRRSELLKHFKTIKAIKSASVQELAAVIPANAAKSVYDHFHQTDEKKDG
ncbi:MAG: excinuclease ABC subunit UvrC [Oscillospiraceae bacterium]|nr:excinuclease ABC subunit UvrC [Oscillospiraceae bacterium]